MRKAAGPCGPVGQRWFRPNLREDHRGLFGVMVPSTAG